MPGIHSQSLRHRLSRPTRPEELLRSHVRQAILAAVKATPGIHPRELCRRLDLGNGDLDFHLHVMEKERILRSKMVHGRRMCFDGESFGDEGHVIPVGTERRVLEYMRTSQTASLREIAWMLDISYKAASYHVCNLRSQGLVDVSTGLRGKAIRFRQDV